MPVDVTRVLSRFINGRQHPVTHEDIPMVCDLGHTLWYTPLTQAKCDMVVGVAQSCGLPVRRLTDAEDAALVLGGYAAVAEITRCGK